MQRSRGCFIASTSSPLRLNRLIQRRSRSNWQRLGGSVAYLQENAAVAVASVRQDLSGKIESLHTSVQSRLMPLEALNFEPIHADIFRLQQSLEDITQRLECLPPSAKVDSLSTAVNQLQTEN